jgi:lipase chaperone LimK
VPNVERGGRWGQRVLLGQGLLLPGLFWTSTSLNSHQYRYLGTPNVISCTFLSTVFGSFVLGSSDSCESVACIRDRFLFRLFGLVDDEWSIASEVRRAIVKNCEELDMRTAALWTRPSSTRLQLVKLTLQLFSSSAEMGIV